MFTPHELRGSASARTNGARAYDSRRGAHAVNASAIRPIHVAHGSHRIGPARVFGGSGSSLALRGDGDSHSGWAGGVLGAAVRPHISRTLPYLDATFVLHLRDLDRAGEQRATAFVETRAVAGPPGRRARAGRASSAAGRPGAGVPRAAGRSGPVPARTSARSGSRASACTSATGPRNHHHRPRRTRGDHPPGANRPQTTSPRLTLIRPPAFSQ